MEINWIDITDTKPTETGSYLVYNASRGYTIGYFDHEDETFDFREGDENWEAADIEYFSALPDAPPRKLNLPTPSKLALEQAAQAWCTEKTSHMEMDADLATAFAGILDAIWGKPWLGNATTKQLLDEVGARVDLFYRTVDQ